MPYRLGKTSRYRGVTLFANQGRYQAFVKIAGTRHHCGMWKDERDAAIARDRAALHFELDAPLNEPRRSEALGAAPPDELRRLARRRGKEGRSSPYFGVTFNSARGRWDAFVGLPGRRDAQWIAQFDTPADAALAYDRAALTVIGPDALRNFPDRAPAPATIGEMRRWSRELFAARLALVGQPSHRQVAQVGVGRNRADGDSYYAVIPGERARVHGFCSESEAAVARERMELHQRVSPPRVSAEAKRLGPATAAQIRRELLARRKEGATSRYGGVHRKQGRTWCWLARIKIRGVERVLGTWRTEREAAIAVDRARIADGELGLLNLPRVSSKLGPAKPAELRAEARRLFKETTTSRFTGVCWDHRVGRWMAQIQLRKKHYHLGRFELEERAAEAYDDAARRLGSNRAKLNFP